MVWLLLLAAGCHDGPPSTDVVGPFTGPTHRYVIDGFTLPAPRTLARLLGADLDGDRHVDNQFGSVVSTLASGGNVNAYAADMIGAGVIGSSLLIQADDALDDDTVGVWYQGAEGAPATPMGGTMSEGVFLSNRTLTSLVPGRAVVHLPLFADADPSVIEMIAMELDLRPDGRGGYDGTVRGAFRLEDARVAAARGMQELISARPQDHRWFWALTDDDLDGTISIDDMEGAVVGSLIEFDVTLTVDGDREHLMSAAFGIHVSPCASAGGSPRRPSCFDRLTNGDETGVDCGGACHACPGAAGCLTAGDCQSGVCDSGICAAPRCDNGRLDGLESDVDCGGPCAPCGPSRVCAFPLDCASNKCLTPSRRCY